MNSSGLIYHDVDYIESNGKFKLFNLIKKNEIGKEALEMIRKYGVDIECKVLCYKLGHR